VDSKAGQKKSRKRRTKRTGGRRSCGDQLSRGGSTGPTTPCPVKKKRKRGETSPGKKRGTIPKKRTTRYRKAWEGKKNEMMSSCKREECRGHHLVKVKKGSPALAGRMEGKQTVIIPSSKDQMTAEGTEARLPNEVGEDKISSWEWGELKRRKILTTKKRERECFKWKGGKMNEHSYHSQEKRNRGKSH